MVLSLFFHCVESASEFDFFKNLVRTPWTAGSKTELEIGLIELISTATNTICSYNLIQEILVSFGKFDDMSLRVYFKKV